MQLLGNVDAKRNEFAVLCMQIVTEYLLVILSQIKKRV